MESVEFEHNEIARITKIEELDKWQLKKDGFVKSADGICIALKNSTEAIDDLVKRIPSSALANSRELFFVIDDVKQSLRSIYSAREALSEIDALLIEKKNQILDKKYIPEVAENNLRSTNTAYSKQGCDLKKGDKIQHNLYGKGVIFEIMPLEEDIIIKIVFVNVGTKEFLMSHVIKNMHKIAFSYMPDAELEILGHYIGMGYNGYDALYELGRRYYYGRAVEKSPRKAVELYTIVAKQGYSVAQCALADCYLDGIGVEKDEIKAFKWYTKAAEQGNINALNMLAECCFSGIGTEKNIAEADKWHERAIEQERINMKRYHTEHDDDEELYEQENACTDEKVVETYKCYEDNVEQEELKMTGEQYECEDDEAPF